MVLAHGKPFAIADDRPGIAATELEGSIQAANESRTMLVSNTRYSVANEMGYDIHQDQSEMVFEAIEKVLARVCRPDPWHSLRLDCREPCAEGK